MTRLRPVTAGLALLLAPWFVAGLAAEQAAPPPATAPSPAEKSPLPTTTAPDPAAKPGPGTAAPAPDKSLAPPALPGAAPSASSTPPVRQTLVPAPAEPNDVEPVTLPAKPAAILPGKTSWEEAAGNLKAAFKRIEEDLAKAGIRPTGRPLAVFTKSEDDGFTYEAMIPVEAAPATSPADGALRFGTTPAGRALRFKHTGSYEEISGTYDTLIAYFDAKDIAVQDRFIEEYVTDLSDGADDRLDVNIYALPK